MVGYRDPAGFTADGSENFASRHRELKHGRYYLVYFKGYTRVYSLF